MTDWLVAGRELIAWVGDLEFFDIVYADRTDTYQLRINHVGTATTLYLGDSDTLEQAQSRAGDFLRRRAPE